MCFDTFCEPLAFRRATNILHETYWSGVCGLHICFYWAAKSPQGTGRSTLISACHEPIAPRTPQTTTAHAVALEAPPAAARTATPAAASAAGQCLPPWQEGWFFPPLNDFLPFYIILSRTRLLCPVLIVCSRTICFHPVLNCYIPC